VLDSLSESITHSRFKMKPATKPTRPFFSSGPCSKRPGWSLGALEDALVGRSHRAKVAKARIQEVIEKSKSILGIPEGYVCGIVPASDTGAVEMAMWSLLGARGVDMMAWESFGSGWVTDVIKQLKLDNARKLEADYGQLPDLSKVDFNNDVVFTYNGTTSGVKVPNLDWIPDDRAGLTICDATSAVFAMDIDYSKLDVVTWSWQKVMGGEGAHGMIVLSPRAIERLESYTPHWPLPKIFRMTKGGKLIDGIFEGATINTISMLCVEDALDGLKWAEEIGGLPALIKRSETNLKAIADWMETRDWIDFLAEDPATRSNTSICLKITADWYQALPEEEQAAKAKQMVALLEKEEVGYDFGSYRDAPAGIRIWGGATVDTADIEALLPWLDWAFEEIQD
jgi:phosphoserine aminotransferase